MVLGACKRVDRRFALLRPCSRCKGDGDEDRLFGAPIRVPTPSGFEALRPSV